MSRLTEVQGLKKRIEEIQKKCKLRKLRIIKNDFLKETFLAECKKCNLPIEMSRKSYCSKCLRKMEYVRNWIDYPNQSEVHEYRCQNIKCDQTYQHYEHL